MLKDFGSVDCMHSISGDMERERYRVDYQYTDITGFSATLFWDTELNKHVIAVRGTELSNFN
ncbi:MAG: hypothetical protein RBR33_07480 [Sulfurovaceae bacterium]|nr:hypothetical protein [Sulfurovaceae bacterium]